MNIVLVDDPTDELLDGMIRLIPQLISSPACFTRENIRCMLVSGASSLIIARSDEGVLIGMLTLIVYRVPTGIRARIEDVVVDEYVRGRGIATALIQNAIKNARARGANGITLTSNPRREQANRLYQKMGFKKWETNVYFYEFE